MIKTREEVQSFIASFIEKANVFSVTFISRDKNTEALKVLGINETIRLELVKQITIEEYSETISDLLSFGDMWVFGKDYDGKEIYIKISLGSFNARAICISFHIAEHQMSHPYKN